MIDRAVFTEEERARFSTRLLRCLDALEVLLSREGFGEGPTTLGAELEVHLVDARGMPAMVNRDVLKESVDPRLTLELDRFNFEVNARPFPLAGRPFTALGAELYGALAEVERSAAPHGARVATTGILPTLRLEHLGEGALTEMPRYHALREACRRRRGGPFRVRIDGDDPLSVETDDVTFEGACASFQIHLRTPPRDFARLYNAAQIATAPVLAASGNSPFFLGHRLWHETRIALFKHAVDDRPEAHPRGFPPARVSFGRGWIRRSALELFQEAVYLHPPMLPICDEQDPLEALTAGDVPSLRELRLHGGTVWTWNRPVYDPDFGGHLRIELRALPSGPTLVDMAAEAAFVLGLTLALARDVDRLLPGFPFAFAERNFYQAAKHGLDAELLWPSADPPSPRPTTAREILPALLPLARAGLVEHGVQGDEADQFLDVIRARVRTGMTGAIWQRRALERLRGARSPEDAWRRVLEHALALSRSGAPVHTWSLDF